jgi:hypothetical protein
MQNLPSIALVYQGEWPCHKCQSVTARRAGSRSAPISDFAPTVEQFWKPSHSHPASMERSLHPRVTHIHSKRHLMRNHNSNCHRMLKHLSSKCLPTCNRRRNNRARSRKRSALLASCSCCAGADFLAIGHNASAVAVVDASFCWSSCSFAWGYHPCIITAQIPLKAFPRA